MNLTAPKSRTNPLLALQSLLQSLAALAPSKRLCNGRSFVWLVLPSLPPVYCREFRAKPPLPRGEEHPQQKLDMEQGAGHGSAPASLTSARAVVRHVDATRLMSLGPHMEQGRGTAAAAAVSLGRGTACLFVLPIVCAQEPQKEPQGWTGESCPPSAMDT